MSFPDEETLVWAKKKYGGSGNGGGGGAKIATFDFAKWDEYEKFISGIEGFNMVKISDEVPTLDELIGGLFAVNYSFEWGPDQDTDGGVNNYAYRLDANSLFYDETMDTTVIIGAGNTQTMVFSKTSCELVNAEFGSMGIEARMTPGIWINAEKFVKEYSSGEWLTVLVWGF